jgi:hypothetical protein
MVAKMVSLKSNLLGAVTKYTALVIGVMELGAVRILAAWSRSTLAKLEILFWA